MSHVIVINTEEINLFGVFRDQAAAEASVRYIDPNTLMVDEEKHLVSLTTMELNRLMNSLEPDNLTEFTSHDIAMKRTWNKLKTLPLTRARKTRKLEL